MIYHTLPALLLPYGPASKGTAPGGYLILQTVEIATQP